MLYQLHLARLSLWFKFSLFNKIDSSSDYGPQCSFEEVKSVVMFVAQLFSILGCIIVSPGNGTALSC